MIKMENISVVEFENEVKKYSKFTYNSDEQREDIVLPYRQILNFNRVVINKFSPITITFLNSQCQISLYSVKEIYAEYTENRAIFTILHSFTMENECKTVITAI
jgi:hypothetical protein